MHYIYGECRGNGVAAANLYRERYPNALRHPDHRVFINVHRAYAEGRVPHNRARTGRPRMDYDEEVLQEIENDPTTSARAIESRTGIPKSTVNRITRRYQYHPYHVQRVQTLLSCD